MNVEIDGVEKGNSVGRLVEEDCSAGVPILTILAIMSNFKSNFKKSYRNNNNDHLLSKDVRADLAPEAKSNWNKSSRGTKTKVFKESKSRISFLLIPANHHRITITKIMLLKCALRVC